MVYHLFNEKKRKIKPLSFISSQTLKTPFPHLETKEKKKKRQNKKPKTNPHWEIHLYKSYTASQPAPHNIGWVLLQKWTRLTDMETAVLNSGSVGYKHCKNISTCIFQTGKWSHNRPEVRKDHSVNQNPILFLGLQGKGKHWSELPLGEKGGK